MTDLADMDWKDAERRLHSIRFKNQWSEYGFCRMLRKFFNYDFDDHLSGEDMRGLDDEFQEKYERNMERYENR